MTMTLTAYVTRARRKNLLADIHDPYFIGALWPLPVPAPIVKLVANCQVSKSDNATL